MKASRRRASGRCKDMMLNTVILKSKRELGKIENRRLREVINKHAHKAGNLLGINLVNVAVNFSKRVIPETGEVGYAADDWVWITIDPTRKSKELEKTIASIIPATIYHEINHIAREKYVGESKNLLEAVITEGLANAFAEEQWPKFKAPWSIYSKNKILPFMRDLENEKKNKKYSYGDWFFGTGDKPRWLGYQLGSYIINSIKEKNINLTALEMTRMTTKQIVKLSVPTSGVGTVKL